MTQMVSQTAPEEIKNIDGYVLAILNNCCGIFVVQVVGVGKLLVLRPPEEFYGVSARQKVGLSCCYCRNRYIVVLQTVSVDESS